MWSSSLFQPSFSTPMAVRVPVSALWPQSELLCIQMENEMARQMDNMRRSADLMNQLQHIGCSGKKEKKEESEGGSYSYKYQEFRRELELPEDVNPEEMSCLLNNGQLRIEAPRMALPSVPERVVPIKSDNSGCINENENLSVL
uniref:SHSP domain-containing protein n=1 Tax=Erpetoichthys calabaricus TaxID=27687 RepID=A0A8C4XFR3_ERPCA